MTTGRLYNYWPERHLKVFEHLPTYGWDGPGSVQDKPNTLLFISGLFDTFASVPYVARIASDLAQRPTNTWSVMEIQLTSFGVGFGTGDLHRDVEEIAKGVEWLRSRSGTVTSNVVLIGHSTGSQDVLHYLYDGSAERPGVEGAILQAPVSDREGLSMVLNAPGESEEYQHHLRDVYRECIRQARQLQNDPAGPSLPRSLTRKLGFMHAYLSPSRLLSLASPDSPDQPSVDDLFSSDLSDRLLYNTFGMVGKKGRLKNLVDVSRPSLLVLISGSDEHMPGTIDKEALLARWKSALEHGGTDLAPSSGVVEGATHNGESMGEAPTDLVDHFLEYLELVEGQSG
jgi:pimeloyl-ACP methyl ester carboxylesterase